MAMLCQINMSLDVPIYQQLVDGIGAAIKKGTLPGGTQLPTVHELALEQGNRQRHCKTGI